MRDTILSWWEARLRARNPLEYLKTQGFDFRPRPGSQDTWPNAVAREALYKDYVAFCEARDVSQVSSELLFYVTLAPWVYPHGKSWHVKNYLVPKRQTYEGRWITLKVRRYFVRLLPWEEHVQAFEENGGPAILSKEGQKRVIYT